jgi:phosphotransferase system  glucose/maltose/N-acetylglucosamine-specific IIC component
MNTVRNDLRFSAIVTAVVAIPLFFIFGWLWNPHGSISSSALHFMGLFGIAPFLYVTEFFGYQQRLAGLVFAGLAQYLWFALWVFMLRCFWQARPRGRNAL